MTRKKVKLVWIASDNARKASFKKRRMGLMKKVSELSTLCGVYSFAIINGPDDESPTIWPSLAAAQQLFRRYTSLPEVERQKKMMNQETYLKERTTKVQDQLKKMVKKNQELETDILMHEMSRGRQLFQLSNAELLGLFWMVEERIRESRKRIEYRQQVHGLPVPGFAAVNEVNLIDNGVSEGRNLFDQWFVDLVMNPNPSDEIGGLGLQCEANVASFNANLGEIEGFGGGKDGEDNLMSHWKNYGGMSEIENIMSNIGGVDDASSAPMEYGGDQMGLGLFPQNGGCGSISGTDAEVMNGLFEGGNGSDILSKGWSSIFSP